MAPQDKDKLVGILNLFSEKSDEARKQGASQLVKYVKSQSRELSGEGFSKFMLEVHRHLFRLVNSNRIGEKIGAIMAVDQLLSLELNENGGKNVSKYANYLRSGLSTSETTVMVMAARALGRLAQRKDTLTAECVEFEIKRALEWLQGNRREARRHAAALVLAELASNAPTLFYVHVDSFFELIWEPLRDPKHHIRLAAAVALRAVLVLIGHREQRLRERYYDEVYGEAVKGFRHNQSEWIHASLLAIGELLSAHDSHHCMSRERRFTSAAQHVFKYKDHRDRLVRRTVIDLLPLLARCSPGIFVHAHLHDCIFHLLHILRKDYHRQRAYLALGHVSVAVGKSIFPYLEKIVSVIRQGIAPRRNHPACEEALTCVSLLAEAVGEQLLPHVSELLPKMLAGGLSEALTSALRELGARIPSLMPEIQERLLDQISMVLANRKFLPPGAPIANGLGNAGAGGDNRNPPSSPMRSSKTGSSSNISSLSGNGLGGGSTSSSRSSSRSQKLSSSGASPTLRRAAGEGNISVMHDVTDEVAARLCLALQTLASFDFSNQNLSEFVSQCVVNYIDHDRRTVREEAVRTCIKLIVPVGERRAPSKGHLARVVGNVLDRLLAAGVSDADPEIRKTVLHSLDSRFDLHLSQSANLRALFLALDDEAFVIREAVLNLLGRLVSHNPAFILPGLRHRLLQLLTELKFAGAAADTASKEESTRLLGHLIRAGARIVPPYVHPVLEALLPGISDSSTRVSTCALAAVGELAQVSGQELRPHLDTLIPLVIDTLLDQSSVRKRRQAFQTLGQLVRCTGCVVEPFVEHPRLLEIVIDAVKGEKDTATRSEVIKLMGTVGALDPQTYKLKRPNRKITSSSSVLGTNRVNGSVVTSTQVSSVSGMGKSTVHSGASLADGSAKGGSVPRVESFQHGSSAAAVAAAKKAATAAALAAKAAAAAAAAAAKAAAAQGNLAEHASTTDELANVLASAGGPESEDYFPRVAIAELLQILRDASLATHHAAVIQAVMYIFKSLGMRCVPFLPRILPAFLGVMRKCEAGFREFLFQQLGVLVAIVRQHVREYLPAIFALVDDYWSVSADLQLQILGLLEQVSVALRDEFVVHMPRLVPQILHVLVADNSHGRQPTLKVLHTLEVLGQNLSGYMHIVVPAVVRLTELEGAPLTVRRQAFVSLERIGRRLNLFDFCSRIVHAANRVLVRDVELREVVFSTLCTLASQLGQEYLVFVPLILKTMMRHRIVHHRYESIVRQLLLPEPDLAQVGGLMMGAGGAMGLASNTSHSKNAFGSGTSSGSSPSGGGGGLGAGGVGGAGGIGGQTGSGGGNGNGGGVMDDEPLPQVSAKKLHVDQANLQRSWQASQLSTREDWAEWIRKFSVELLRWSPSPALRACLQLAQVYQPIARRLFNSSFVSCWSELDEQYQDRLVSSLETALRSQTIPPEILQTLLDLAEFMEQNDRPLPIDYRTLGMLAEQCHAYAKALHYKEIEFRDNPTASPVLVSLISINNKLKKPAAAMGILTYAQNRNREKGNEFRQEAGWYEKLGRWEDALKAYQQQEREGAMSIMPTLGQIRCLHALGRWEAVSALCSRVWVPLSIGSGRVRLAASGHDLEAVSSGSPATSTASPLAAMCASGQESFSSTFMSSHGEAAGGGAEGKNGSTTMTTMGGSGVGLNIPVKHGSGGGSPLSSASPLMKDESSVAAAAAMEQAEQRHDVARIAADAAWHLGHWQDMKRYVAGIAPSSVEHHFYMAVHALHRRNFERAQKEIDRCRELVDVRLTALVGESYNRAYQVVVVVQQLSEMEEIVELLRAQDQAVHANVANDLRARYLDIWNRRLLGCQASVEVWQRVLALRSLVVKPSEDMGTLLKFASLCRSNGNFRQSGDIIANLFAEAIASRVLGENNKSASQSQSHAAGSRSKNRGRRSRGAGPGGSSGSRVDIGRARLGVIAGLGTRGSVPEQVADLLRDGNGVAAGVGEVCYAYLKHLWAAGHHRLALQQMEAFVGGLSSYSRGGALAVDSRLRARCMLKHGRWMRLMLSMKPAAPEAELRSPYRRRPSIVISPDSDQVRSRILQSFRVALKYQPQWHKAWHWWAMLNFEAVVSYERRAEMLNDESEKEFSSSSSNKKSNRIRSGSTQATTSDTMTNQHDTLTREDPHRATKREKKKLYAKPQHRRSWASDQEDEFDEDESSSLEDDRLSMSEEEESSDEEDDEDLHHRHHSHSTSSGKKTDGVHENEDSPLAIERRKLREQMRAHILPAIRGFFQAIALGPGGNLQDILRLLTLWFRHAGQYEEVEVALREGFENGSVPIEQWLQVCPQLIARTHSPVRPVRRLVHDLLALVGREHPQALVYPLTVASEGRGGLRVAAARSLLQAMKQHSPKLVEQALMLSEELIRVTILWHEMWHGGLEDASRLYFGEHSVQGMFDTLAPLHRKLEEGPTTLNERAFHQAFSRDLAEAHEWCRKFSRSGKVAHLNQAWDLYYHVFRRINKQLPQLMTLELQYVSPKLLQARQLELAVPGSYRPDPNIPVVRIDHFSSSLKVISSKQRPRKLSVWGSDGLQYTFLLKGHEDLRQDERVMQLFGLVNTLLAEKGNSNGESLAIRRYAVIPLSPNIGLICWVMRCDTFHQLIRKYREARKILLNIEHRLMLQMCSDYEHLPLINKVEVFEHALASTNGQDLNRILWLRSRNSEVWLDRRTNYTRSLAVMSMVGYVLGLGDRHPSNLMLERATGNVIHIDFGDCFEVAMKRDKYPEKVPFRLTRMLINAMEVSGIEGTYRSTCENVLRVLRNNRDSLMAVLEAFVYDPLVDWRLHSSSSSTASRRGGAALAESVNAAGESNWEDAAPVPDESNRKAVAVIERVRAKLTGHDFPGHSQLNEAEQVQLLVEQATSHANLAIAYTGWCAFW